MEIPPRARRPLHETMPDLDKLYEKADKYLQRQKFEAAIETYQEILRYEPNDEEALINLGDLSLKLNRTAEALRYQVQLADYYIKRGDIPKAIATCRKVLKLSPQDVVTLMKLAGLLERSQKNSEALEAYREALGHYRRAGSNTQMLDCLTRIVKLDPNNLEEHVELAELASRSRQTKVAMPALLRAAQLARRAGDESRWEELVDQAHTLDPADEVASIAATELYLKRGNAAEAAKLIEPLLAKKPDDLEVLELACRGFLGSWQLHPGAAAMLEALSCQTRARGSGSEAHGRPDPDRGSPASVGNGERTQRAPFPAGQAERIPEYHGEGVRVGRVEPGRSGSPQQPLQRNEQGGRAAAISLAPVQPLPGQRKLSKGWRHAGTNSGRRPVR